jgi:predicted metal-dependent HD superfamily phosphohydrolase
MEKEILIDAPARKALGVRYSGTDRHYHGTTHIEALLSLAREYRAALSDPQAVEAAIWFHDAIYDSRRNDNEQRSAELARDMLVGRMTGERLGRIAAMIEATATHELPSFEGDALRDAALFLDMDLSILGAEPQAFDAYEDAVRREYGWVEDVAWNAGRAAVLKKFLAREHIFHTEEFRGRFEAKARANLERSIGQLTAGRSAPA